MLRTKAGRPTLGTAVVAVFGLLMSSPADAQDVLLLEDGDGVTIGASVLASATTGFTITSEGPTAFAARTDFSSFDVVYLACTISPPARTAAKFNAAFQAAATEGRVVISGHAALFNTTVPGATQFLQDSIAWVAGGVRMGVIAACDFPTTIGPQFTWDHLPFPGIGASCEALNVQDENVNFVGPQHSVFANNTDGPGTVSMDNWNFSVHVRWETLGAGNGGYEDDGFLAIATSDTGNSSSVGTKVCALVADFNATIPQTAPAIPVPMQAILLACVLSSGIFILRQRLPTSSNSGIMT